MFLKCKTISLVAHNSVISKPKRHVALLSFPGPYSWVRKSLSDSSKQMLGGFKSMGGVLQTVLKLMLTCFQVFKIYSSQMEIFPVVLSNCAVYLFEHLESYVFSSTLEPGRQGQSQITYCPVNGETGFKLQRFPAMEP